MTVGAAPPASPVADDVEDVEHDDVMPTWPPLPSWIDPALEVDASEDLPDDLPRFVREALPQLAALGVVGARAHEVIAHCATECGRGRRAHGHNRGGVKLKERDDASHRRHHGAGLAWWRDLGHAESGDPLVVYYRAFDDDASFWRFWINRYVPRDAEPTERYAATGRAFWRRGGDWFAAMLLAGYRGDERQKEVQDLIVAGADVGTHPSVAEHRRLTERVRELAASP